MSGLGTTVWSPSGAAGGDEGPASHFKRWGAAYVLFVLFLGSWVGRFFTQLQQTANEAAAHGQSFQWGEFWPAFGQATFENWQSEWLQLFVQAVLLLGMKHLLFKADAEDMERLEAKVDALLLSRSLAPDLVRPAGGGEPSRALADDSPITAIDEET